MHAAQTSLVSGGTHACASARMAGGSCASISSSAVISTSSRTSGGKLASVVARSSSCGPPSPLAAAACFDYHFDQSTPRKRPHWHKNVSMYSPELPFQPSGLHVTADLQMKCQDHVLT